MGHPADLSSLCFYVVLSRWKSARPTIAEFGVEVSKHHFDKATVVNSVNFATDCAALWANNSKAKFRSYDFRKQPRFRFPLIWCMREISVFVVKPSGYLLL